MDVIWLQALTLDWWVPAACDLIAISATVGITLLLRRSARPAPVAIPVTRSEVAPLKSEIFPDAPVPGAEPTSRTDVKRALAAIGRWEESYRSGRGVAELARFVQSQSSREASGR